MTRKTSAPSMTEELAVGANADEEVRDASRVSLHTNRTQGAEPLMMGYFMRMPIAAQERR